MTLANRKSAAALAYDATDTAPRVLAKGHGPIAEAIIRKAEESGLYVHRSPELVALLMQVDLDDHIPAQLYRAVAELLAWLYSLENSVASPAPLARGVESPSFIESGTNTQ